MWRKTFALWLQSCERTRRTRIRASRKRTSKVSHAMNNDKTPNPADNGVGSTGGSALTCYRCNNEHHQCVCPELAETWEDSGCCGMCDGSGVIDGYEDDPNWYHPGETKPCPQCGGTGL